MTAINIIKQADRVHLITDGLSSSGLINKAIPVPHLNLAIACSGAFGAGLMVAAEANQADSYDDLKENIGELMRHCEREFPRQMRTKNEPDFEIFVAGISETEGPGFFSAVSHRLRPGVQPYIANSPGGAVLIQPCTPAITSAVFSAWQGIPSDALDPLVEGPRMIQLQRQHLNDAYGNDVPAALASTEAAAMRANAAIKQVNDTGKETFRGFATDFRSAIANGATAWQAFEQAGANALNRIADKLVSMAADNLWASAFGGSGSGGLFGLLGFGGGSGAASGGGYAMSSGLGAGTGGLSFPMFADGTDSAPGGWSIVGERGPELVNLPRGAAVTPNHAIGKMASNDNSVQVTYSPTYQVTGNGEDIESLKRQMAKDRADFESKTIAAVRNAQKARKLAYLSASEPNTG